MLKRIKEADYTPPQMELYLYPIEEGFLLSNPDWDKDNDFEYGDGGDAWD